MASEFDAVVYDPRFSPYRGWHDDYAVGQTYLPAVQQVRAEFLALAEAIQKAGLNGKALQLGLGHAGGAHRLFQKLFHSVCTIESDTGPVCGFLERFQGDFIVGYTGDESTKQAARKNAPYDFLFIDAGHRYHEVKADFENYSPMVRKGGMIAFHDAVQRNNEIEVWKFLDELESTGYDIRLVGSIGTAWLFQ